MQASAEQDVSSFAPLRSQRATVRARIHPDMLVVIALVLFGGIAGTSATGNPQLIIVTAGGSLVAALLDRLA